MKHAFIFGTNIYISEKNTVSYGRNGDLREFLVIRSFFDPQQKDGIRELIVDADFSLTNNEPVKVVHNKIVTGINVNMVCEPDRVKIYHVGHEVPVLDIFQLDRHEFGSFGTIINSELMVQDPDIALTIKGNIKVGEGYISIDNEHLYVDEETFAGAVNNAHHGVIITADQKIA
ncbi:hypothetical protein [Mucilaginibacter celer]|nr:hypothetical protein [Mucilaginibacter celer]